ncbi:hypothetical protein [Streptomyces roseifaciens]|uniref:hypothetical protein n=1 Tax=Streptomyces roseifaciens TaxID=1488406 RepID=UPI000AFAC839|nr:hypothetical protein [Streptomyces roseifaciens]
MNSVVARCLLEPGYLDRLARDPQRELTALPVDEETRAAIGTLDVGQVRLFAGFVTKVQHNDLWDTFPRTRALLRYYGIELETFADYRAHYVEMCRAGKPSRAEKAARFLRFLERRLRDSARANCPGLLDVLIHERLQWEVTQEVLGHRRSAPVRPAAREVRAGSLDQRDQRVVVACDVIRVAALDHDPLEIAARLQDGGSALAHLEPKAVCFCYWGRTSEQTVSVLTVDTATAAVLSAVDGHRSVDDVLDESRAVLPEAGRTHLARVLDGAVHQGLVLLVDSPAREVG